MGHYVYRYVDNDTGEILYVGKSDSSLNSRIAYHKQEQRFLNIDVPYHIEYIELDNELTVRFCELYYINKYKPRLNEKDKYSCEMSVSIDETGHTWLPYNEENLNKTKMKAAPIIDKNKPVVFKESTSEIYQRLCESDKEEFDNRIRRIIEETTRQGEWLVCTPHSVIIHYRVYNRQLSIIEIRPKPKDYTKGVV